MNKKQKRKVYLNEYNVLLSDTVYLPLASGLLQAYAQSRPEIAKNYEFMPIFYKRDYPDNIISAYDKPDVAAFSVSAWTERLCLNVAQQIKKMYPKCLVVFGGPQVPFDAKEYFSRYPFVDVSVRGEGERAFAQILERFLSTNNFGDIPGISYRNQQTPGYERNNAEQPKITDDNLDIFLSPYLTGVFDPFLKMGLKWQAIIETNRGCPFPCAYCFWGHGGLNRKFRYFSMKRIADEVDWCGKNKIEYLFCADSNFGMLDRDMEIAEILAETKKKYGYPERFRVNYGKNTDDKIFKIAKYLHEYELEKAITISFQSFNEEALSNVNRKNIKLSTFQNLQQKYVKDNIPTYSELILGLPGETYDTWVNGLEQCLSAGIKNNVFIYLLQIFPNTGLSDPQYKEKYKVQTVKMPLREGHGAIRPEGSIDEYEDVVIGTYSMPPDEWKKAAVFSWLLQAFVGLKLGLFVLIYLKEEFEIKYVDVLKYISELKMKSGSRKVIKDNAQYLWNLADSITKGTPRTMEMNDFGNIYWEAEESFYFRISDNKEGFYSDFYDIVREYLGVNGYPFDEKQLEDVFEYQRIRLPQHTNIKRDSCTFKYNIPEYFDNYFLGKKIPIVSKPQSIRLMGASDYGSDKKTFARETVIYGRKGNKLLYRAEWTNHESQIWNKCAL